MEYKNNVLLNGEWQVGTDRIYDRVASVPGLASDPKVMNDGALWYKRKLSCHKVSGLMQH